MSSTAAPTDSVQSAPHAPGASSKKKANKKKKSNNAAKAKPSPDPVKEDGAASAEADDVSADEQQQPELPGLNAPRQEEQQPDEPPPPPESPRLQDESIPDQRQPDLENTNGHAGANGHATTPTTQTSMAAASSSEETTTSAKLEAMSQDREALRAEVEKLRKQLESIQETHSHEVSQLKTDLEESEAAKEHAESQYQTLLGRVEKIKETLGDRLKRDKAELEEAKDRIEELEAQNEELQRASRDGGDEAARLREEVEQQGRELASLRSRSSLSQQNWAREKDDMARQMQHLRVELESTRNAMGEWEVIAMEERSMREGLSKELSDLEEQLQQVREAYERVASERDTQSHAIDGLQRALQEIQEARKRELREMVESTEEQVAAMKKRVQEADAKAKEAESARESLSKELERTAPFEKEVKEKNLLIGKLRHEAIVLNDHLTKALKYIKKTKPEETIDRQIVTNHFLQFLALDRSDPRKFQILQVIAGLLNWTDEQREQAGLARPGGAGNHHQSTLRLPTSPFHRTPSSPALNTEFFSEPTSASAVGGRESLAELWTDFLAKAVEDPAGAPHLPGGGLAGKGRQDSMSSVTTSGTSNTKGVGG
ncbi:hypothetical protein B0H66DRAFT_565113 [Apodospora peruviana]|uniref:GRIP domain-containing protein n=1 Tax=Apodospora peruviana TaxID=516989 RepID=A0AAE0HYQ1_9PEZI|nr:hypothetical protein B0H66DRAFT_565113 [Apodospora peruviana]